MYLWCYRSNHGLTIELWIDNFFGPMIGPIFKPLDKSKDNKVKFYKNI